MWLRQINLLHWGQVTNICVGKLSIIGSDNGLSPGRRQAIILTNAGILLIGPPGTYFRVISIGINTISIKEMQLKMSCAKWRSFCLGLNELKHVKNMTIHERPTFSQTSTAKHKTIYIYIYIIKFAMFVWPWFCISITNSVWKMTKNLTPT